MARRSRRDNPDTWHHVMNRGVARRPIFENDLDRRFFLSLLAQEVRAGRLEIHAFCLMLTHFHLLVRSVTGELSEAMRRIQNRYARWFNRSRKRDGPLFRGRFLSRFVDTLGYRRNVVTYIHDNAVAAGLVADPADYAWSSAKHYAEGKSPRWLETSWVISEMDARGSGATQKERLATAFASRIDEDFRTWVERQLHRRLPEQLGEEAAPKLLQASSWRVVRWTYRKTELADGTRPWRPVCPPNVVDRALKAACERRSARSWAASRARRRTPGSACAPRCCASSRVARTTRSACASAGTRARSRVTCAITASCSRATASTRSSPAGSPTRSSSPCRSPLPAAPPIQFLLPPEAPVCPEGAALIT